MDTCHLTVLYTYKWKLAGLDARVDIKATVFLAWASTEYNQAPLFYATDPAVAACLLKVYILDVQDFMTRFEGYSITGGMLAGASAALLIM